MQLELAVTREKLLGVATTTLFVLFVIFLPRYTDIAKTWFLILILIGFFFLAFNLKQIKDTTTAERLFFSTVVLNFLWMALSFYANGEPSQGASFLWSRHFYFLFLIPLFFLFRIIDIPDKIVMLSLFGSVALSLTDILIDLSQGIDHRLQGMNPNAFAPIQLCMSGMLLFYFINPAKRPLRWLALLGFVLGLATVVFSISKTTWLTIPVLSIFFIFYILPTLSLAKRAALALGILLLLSSTYLLPIVKNRIDFGVNNVSDYLASDNFQDDSGMGTFGTRIELWKAGWNIFLENPILGAGLGGFREMNQAHYEHYRVNKIVLQFKYVHNQYLAALATRGIPGLILLLMILFLPIYIAMSQKAFERKSGIAQLSILFICLTYIIGCIAEDHFEGKSATMFVGIFLPLWMAKLSISNSREGADG